MHLPAQRILALLASASVLFASVHCACASQSGRTAADRHPSAGAAHRRTCCSHQSHPGRPGAPLDTHQDRPAGCQHCQPVLEARAVASLGALKVSTSRGPPFPPLSLPSPELGSTDCLACPSFSRDLPPPHDGRTVLRLHCTLLL